MSNEEAILFCVDMGTTRTRAWITENEKAWAFESRDFGVRDVAGGQSRSWLAAQLGDVLSAAYEAAASCGLRAFPSAILAAGMITSDQGLRSIPHLTAPVNVSDLARNLHAGDFPMRKVGSLPLLLVPGVRTSCSAESVNGVLQMDLIRGEETLCMGLLERGLLRPETALVTLGSHWKWVWINQRGEISHSRTTLSGEMIHAAQTRTLIASSLPQEPPKMLDDAWVERGFLEASRAGLGRALFCVRLLDLQGYADTEERLSFLYGAFLEDEIAHLPLHRGEPIKEILVAGQPSLTRVWKHYVEKMGVCVTLLEETEREQAYLLGLRSIHANRVAV